MLSKIKSNLRTSYINARGWRTNRKIVVFESDDWGAIRLPDVLKMDAYRKINPKTQNPYLKYDSLASTDDLTNLFSIIKDFKDNNGNHPIFTFNTVVANPDFEKIKENNFQTYYYEPFTETLKKYSAHSSAFNLWQDAMNEKLMYPQFHGREHINVPLWLGELRSGNKDFLSAFELGTWCISQKIIKGINPQASLDWVDSRPIAYQDAYITEGLSLFEEIFGFKPLTMIPNNFVLGVELHEIIKKSGIKVLQGMNYQKLPMGNTKKRKVISRYLGSENEEKTRYFVRNCQFEPSQTASNYDDVNQCIKEISNAFMWNRPAIINSHRLNYVGVYDQKFRDENLKSFKALIKNILERWPDVEFMDSEKLAILMNENI
jgi:hypothetical protein